MTLLSESFGVVGSIE
nr:TPA_asm: m07 uORF [Murid betaherpesvirus 1]DBA07709.1 TPA_asm: m07 uORF [Murid betaherpesvirus 1]